jgi:hypothetical protein
MATIIDCLGGRRMIRPGRLDILQILLHDSTLELAA